MKIKIEESFEVEKNTRLYEVLIRLYMSSAKDQGKIFKSKRYYRREEHRNRIVNRAHSIIRKINKEQDLGWLQWEISKSGSNNLFDVMGGKRQEFIVKKKL
jgi:hypothetical protein